MREDWLEIELGKVCDKATKVKRKAMPAKSSFLYLDIGGIDNKSNKIVGHKTYQWKDAPSRAQQCIKVGDVLFSTVRTYLRNIALVSNSQYEGQICSSGFTVIRGKEKILRSKYCFYFSLFEGFLQPLSEFQTGTSYPAVRDKDVFAQKIPLPPLPEQRAIVSKIEQLFSELDHGIANLKAAKTKLDTYRQAVLKKAFEGELTKEWRKNQNRGLSLAAEPSAEYNQVKQSQAKKNGSKAAPEAWELQKLGELGTWKGGGTPSKRRNDFWENGSILWVSPKDMKVHRITSTIDQISETAVDESSAKWIDAGAILIVVRSGIIRRKLPVAVAGQRLTVNQDIQTITPNDTLDSEFLYWFFMSRDRDIRQKCAKDGTTVDSINVPALKAYEISVPNLEEQTQIVHEIESRLSVCDKLSESIDQSLEQATALRQSILKKAFEGRLLSEAEVEACKKEPDWEPAEQLLARIERSRNERIKESTNDKKSKSKNSKKPTLL